MGRPIPITALALSVVVLLPACRGTPQTTRVAAGDYDAMAVAMAESLARSDALAGRGPGSEPWVVSLDRVTNLSSEVMSLSEQWAVMERVRGSLPIRSLGDRKRVTFVLPAERRAELTGNTEGVAVKDRVPTHQLTATFRSLTRTAEDRRVELYYCEFELFDVRGGAPVWADRFEYKRVAHGAVWD